MNRSNGNSIVIARVIVIMRMPRRAKCIKLPNSSVVQPHETTGFGVAYSERKLDAAVGKLNT